MDIDIIKKFSLNPDKYYKTKLFEEYNFERRACIKCNRFFWSLDENKTLCPEDESDSYSFIGNPHTNKRLDYVESLHAIKSFFAENHHTIINRYPVVCRWREDLYFTIASIVNFQRIIDSKVIFELPANPLLVPQICLRFNDIENVGTTGKHFSSFCMIGQHSIYNEPGGYWKDKCIELDFRLLTEKFRINKNEIVFVEDVWEGGGSFGASLEYFVNGLELGNAVFTEFQGKLTEYTKLKQMVVDMGAGLERMAWISTGSPTAYDCCFGDITKNIIYKLGIDVPANILNRYFKAINKTEKYNDILECKKMIINSICASTRNLNDILTLESVYLILDHIRTLIFAVKDGMIPSNVGGGYNLRIITRRIITTINKLKTKIDINEIIEAEINYLKNAYPEIANAERDVKTILDVEYKRYSESKMRMDKIATKMKINDKKLSIEKLIQLYESDGITPDYLKERNIISKYPANFYSLLSKKNNRVKTRSKNILEFEDVRSTELLFYTTDPREFKANVLKVYNKYIILDRTAFYARGGGQEPDYGKISTYNVINVIKHGKIIVHEVDCRVDDIKTGDIVKCSIDITRRRNITKHHTSTHIINSASRRILGNWVWQNSAFKESGYGRLDIIHHSSLTNNEIVKIEKMSNNIIQQDLIVNIKEYERSIAEHKFGFKIYQGGVAPFRYIRIVNIGDFDVEACGGTHVKRTGEIGIIKITKTERIQDGVIRIEFVSGEKAIEYVQEQESHITNITKLLQTEKPKVMESFQNKLTEFEETKEKLRYTLEKTSENEVSKIIKTSKILGKLKLHSVTEYKLDEKYHIDIGKKSTKQESLLVYCALIVKKNIKIVVFSGNIASKTMKANEIAYNISKILGGSSGGDEEFAQGGGTDKSKINIALSTIENIMRTIK